MHVLQNQGAEEEQWNIWKGQDIKHKWKDFYESVMTLLNSFLL